MKNMFIKFGITGGLEFFSDKDGMFCYRCGKQIYTGGENCETDRFGRSFCCKKCRKIYYGGKAK